MTMKKARKKNDRLTRSPDVRLKYSPQGETLREFHKARDWARILIGPLGSGKTHACIEEMLWCMDNQTPDRHGIRRSRWAAVRNTYSDLENTTIKDFAELVCDEMGLGSVKMTAPPSWKHQYLKRDGTTVSAEVVFLAMDLPKDEKRARGMQLSGVWFNEMKELAKNNIDMLMGRVGRFPPKSSVPDRTKHVIGDSNAPDRDHWLAVLAKDHKPDGWWFGIQPAGVVRSGGKWVINPGCENRRNLDDDYYERQIGGKKETWIQKNLANEFVRHVDGRPVHPDFSENLHVADHRLEPAVGLPIYGGFDFGRSPAGVFFQPQVNGQILVLSEVVCKNKSAILFGGPVKRHINAHYDNFTIERLTGDPSGDFPGEQVEESAMDILRTTHNLDVYPAYTNDFESRTSMLDKLLTTLIDGQPALLVSPECKTLIKGLTGDYQFRRLQVVGEERFHDKPVKDDTSHVCEALHYGLMGAGEYTSITAEHDDFDYAGDYGHPAEVFE